VHAPGEHPLVSIGMPVRNGAPLVDRALTLLRAQTWAPLEIVVSDNCSTDDTPAILARHAAADPRVRVDRAPAPLDAYPNFERVLGMATGELFMWAAHDDLWAPDHVERLVPRLDDPEVSLAAAVTEVVDDHGELIRTFTRLPELQVDDRWDRVDAYIRMPETDGKASLFYGLHRRAQLLALDLVPFLRRDPRREDVHVVLATLLAGRLSVDEDLRFGMTLGADRRKPLGTRLRDSVRSTKVAAGWIAAYPGVVEELADVPAPARQRVRAATRVGLAHYAGWRLRTAIGSLRGRGWPR
jgi:glycosyltransferase involved in cell wall biosynthesis